jgi:hypothetical protein
MIYVQLVTLLAVVQFTWFGLLVGKARVTYGVAAPAASGNEMFERYFRVQMNTLEQLVCMLPAMWIAAQYTRPVICAALGAVYLFGRLVYLRSYVEDPKKRSAGFGLTLLPTVILVVMALVGIVRALAQGGSTP